MVEREHEELVVGVEELEQELLDGRARVDHALAEHAVALVEQDAKADGHPFVGELRNGLRLAVFENLERFARQAGRQAAFGVEDRGRDRDHVDTRSKDAVAPLNLLGLGRGGHDRQRNEAEERDEPRSTHTFIVNPSHPSGHSEAGRVRQKRNAARKLVMSAGAKLLCDSMLRPARGLHSATPCADC